MDLRELIQDPEEFMRVIFSGMMKSVWTSMPARITQDTKDGHVAVAQPTVKRAVTDQNTGKLTYEDHPDHVDVPIHHRGGGGVSHTDPCKVGDTGTILYSSRPLDTWFQSDGTQQPIDNRMHSIADGTYISGIRSIPRALKQVAKDSSQTRSDDKKNVIDHHPTNGTHIKNVDPSTAAASDTFDPFTQATKFFEHLVHPSNGISGNATDGGTTHSHGLDHTNVWMKVVGALHSVLVDATNGASMNASNLLHQVLAHPTMGALLSAQGGEHIVQAHPTNGVMIDSTTQIALNAPSVSLPAGSISASNLASGSASSSIGTLGGDLSGTLPNPQVVGILHVVGADSLPNYPNDIAASGGGVAVGSLYRNGSILMVRVT